VSHAGLVLLRQLADKTGLTAGLSRALATPRLLIHDRGRVAADLACAIADGGEVISDLRVLTDQKELFGPVASVPTAWRALDEIATGGPRVQARITKAVNAARRRAWAAAEARHGAIPGVRVADKVLEGVTCIRLDATVTPAHSDKELAEPNFKGFDLLTELPDVAAAQEASHPSGRSLRCPKHPDCQALAAISPARFATETGHTVLNHLLSFSSLPIFDISRRGPRAPVQSP